MVRSLHIAEENWFAVIAARPEPPVHARVMGLVDFSPGDPDEVPGNQEDDPPAEVDEDSDGESVLALIKAMPGNISLESVLREIDKLTAIRAIGLPENLFADVGRLPTRWWIC